MKVSRHLCDHISEWYFNIFQHIQEALQTHTEDIEETWQTDLVCQQEEESV